VLLKKKKKKNSLQRILSLWLPVNTILNKKQEFNFFQSKPLEVLDFARVLLDSRRQFECKQMREIETDAARPCRAVVFFQFNHKNKLKTPKTCLRKLSPTTWVLLCR
jgi:hypothetical protein